MAANNISSVSGQAEGFAGIGAARANGQTIKTVGATSAAETFAPNTRDSRGNPDHDSFNGKKHGQRD